VVCLAGLFFQFLDYSFGASVRLITPEMIERDKKKQKEIKRNRNSVLNGGTMNWRQVNTLLCFFSATHIDFPASLPEPADKIRAKKPSSPV